MSNLVKLSKLFSKNTHFIKTIVSMSSIYIFNLIFFFRNHNKDSDLDNSKFEVSDEVKTHTNGFVQHGCCVLCGLILESKEDIVMHSQICEAITYNKNVPRRANAIVPPSFSCNICKKIFNKKHNLNKHSKLHTGNIKKLVLFF